MTRVWTALVFCICSWPCIIVLDLDLDLEAPILVIIIPHRSTEAILPHFGVKITISEIVIVYIAFSPEKAIILCSLFNGCAIENDDILLIVSMLPSQPMTC